MSKSAIKYLRKIEGNMGNGQCPQCGEWMHPSWGDKMGHKRSCLIGKALSELGEDVMWSKKMPDNTQKRSLEAMGKQLEDSWSKAIMDKLEGE